MEPKCTGECEQPSPNKVVELVWVSEIDFEVDASGKLRMVTTDKLKPKDHSLRFLDPWKGDHCPKGVPRSPRCNACDCAECRYCGQIIQIG